MFQKYKQALRENDLTLFLTLALVTFVSRLPFIFYGYGVDPDAWRVASVARIIADTGKYVFARVPGNPVHEYAMALIYQSGPALMNAATALMSAVAVAAFALVVKRIWGRGYLIAALALAATPVVYINSVSTIDYMWALGFAWLGCYFLLKDRTVLAGILLGLAVGCRITSGALIIPFALLYIRLYGWRTPQLAWFGVLTLLTGALCYVPNYLSYGWGFFDFWERGYPAPLTVARRMTLYIWGRFGVLAIGGALLAHLIMRLRGIATDKKIYQQTKSYTWIWVVGIALYAISYLRLPHDQAYLIPLVPFVILLLGETMHRRVFQVACVMIALASFIEPCKSVLCAGEIFRDSSQRIAEVTFSEEILAYGKTLPDNSVLVTGWWQPKLPTLPGDKTFTLDGVDFVYVLDSTSLKQYLADSASIYFIPSVIPFNEEYYDLQLQDIVTSVDELDDRRLSW